MESKLAHTNLMVEKLLGDFLPVPNLREVYSIKEPAKWLPPKRSLR
jgi:hypothetical protein